MINVLPKEIAELIAAGEVIERPSSVIKELVENSIDSGARHVTVEIKNGGTTYMRVTDDGCGIAREDVPTAFLRHATSKIVQKSDLDKIMTLGFRGEALASVCAVAKVELLTKQRSDTYGTIYNIAGSEEISYESGGCPDGTTIIVRDIFYNVPARAKFLKKDVTEANAVSNIVQKIALSHPDIAIRMIRDNRTEFNTPGDGELFSAIYAVFGKDFTRDLIETDYSEGRIKVRGFVVKPLYSKANRSFQNFFVNGRYIRSKLCSAALENAYENMIMTGKFPACVLMIDVPPDMMDVNIHPSKAEVRFTDEKAVTNAIYFAVKNAFIAGGLIYEFDSDDTPRRDWTKKPEPDPEPIVQGSLFETAEEPQKPEPEPKVLGQLFTAVEDIRQLEEDIKHRTEVINESLGAMDSPVGTAAKFPEIPQNTAHFSEAAPCGNKDVSAGGFRYINNAPKPAPEPAPMPEAPPEIRIVGEAFGLYIIAEIGGELVIVDKHAAHERIIFERLKSRNCRQYSQKLLVNIRLLMTNDEFDALEENTELLEDLGFAFDFSDKPYIVATAVPTFLEDSDAEVLIFEVANNLKMHKQNPQSGMLDDILHNMACKAAIKAHDKSSPEEMKSLVEQVLADENVRHCPHGRPVMFTMTKYQIDHRFKRT